jgi:transposase-like protein
MKLEDVARQKALSTEEKCIAYLEKMRWPNGVRCPECGGDSISRFQSKGKTGKVRHLYQCLDKTCRYQFSTTTGTIFHDSHLPLNKWFSAVALICDSSREMSVNQLRMELGVQYKTAAHVSGRVRQAMEHGSIELHRQVPPAVRTIHPRPLPVGPRPAAVASRLRVPATTDPLAERRSATASLLSEMASRPGAPVSSTTVDNMLSMFVSLTQLSIKPPLFFVKYIRDKVFT